MTHDHASQGDRHAHDVDCSAALAKLFDFLDGELDESLESRLKAHVASCKHCFEVADFERRFLEVLQTARDEEKCPRALRERIVSTLRTEGLGA